MKPSPTLTAVIMLNLLLLATILFGAWRSHSLQNRLDESVAALTECRQLVDRIKAARSAPEIASEQQTNEEELTRRIEAWASQAGIRGEQVLRIDPLPGRRSGDSDYLVQGVDVELGKITLPQLAAFSQSVRSEDSRLRVSQLRLSALEPLQIGAGSTETWDGEIALTYLLHSPRSP